MSSMLTKTKKKFAKFQNLNFHNSLNNFGRDPTMSTHVFVVVVVVVFLFVCLGFF